MMMEKEVMKLSTIFRSPFQGRKKNVPLYFTYIVRKATRNFCVRFFFLVLLKSVSLKNSIGKMLMRNKITWAMENSMQNVKKSSGKCYVVNVLSEKLSNGTYISFVLIRNVVEKVWNDTRYCHRRKQNKKRYLRE